MTNNNWELVKLGDILNFKTGRLDSNAATLNGEYPFFTCSPETLSINSYAFDDEAVLLAGNNANGVFSVKYYIGKFNAYQRTYVITSKDRNLVSIRWLYFRIKHVTAELQKMSVGTATKFLTKKILDNFEIRLPTLIEQESIANILWSLQSQIDINIQINQTLESIAQAIFKSWFIDFDPVRAKIAAKQEGKDSELAAMCVISGKSEAELEQMAEDDFAELQATAALFPDELIESELGEVPKGWGLQSLYDTAEFVNGAAFKAKDFSSNTNEGLPIIKIAELKQGLSAQTKYTNLSFDQKYRVRSGDIFYSWSGSPETSLDVFKWFGGDGWLNQHIFKINTESKGKTYFVYYLLKYLKPTLIRLATNKQTTGLGHITVADMKSLQVIKPEEHLFLRYAKIVAPFYEKESLLKQEIINLAMLRDTLLPKLLSGEVSLGDVIDA